MCSLRTRIHYALLRIAMTIRRNSLCIVNAENNYVVAFLFACNANLFLVCCMRLLLQLPLVPRICYKKDAAAAGGDRKRLMASIDVLQQPFLDRHSISCIIPLGQCVCIILCSFSSRFATVYHFIWPINLPEFIAISICFSILYY